MTEVGLEKAKVIVRLSKEEFLKKFGEAGTKALADNDERFKGLAETMDGVFRLFFMVGFDAGYEHAKDEVRDMMSLIPPKVQEFAKKLEKLVEEHEKK